MSNPYELRFRLLEMASSYLYDQQEKQRSFAVDAWEFAKEQGDANIKMFEDLQPKSYSIEDIKKKATDYWFKDKDDPEQKEGEAVGNGNTNNNDTI